MELSYALIYFFVRGRASFFSVVRTGARLPEKKSMYYVIHAIVRSISGRLAIKVS